MRKYHVIFLGLWMGLLPSCVVSLRTQTVGTVRSATELGAQEGGSLAVGHTISNGLLLAGMDINAGVFQKQFAFDTSAKIEYLHFFSRYASVISLHAGSRFVGNERGNIVFVQGAFLEPFPHAHPFGYLGVTLWGGWGWGNDAVRGGMVGIGLLWEFCDLYRWRDKNK